MQINLKVVKLKVEAYKSKKTGADVAQPILVCLDEADKGIDGTLDLAVRKDDEAKLSRDMVGKVVTFNVSEVRPIFGGRVKFNGQIIKLS